MSDHDQFTVHLDRRDRYEFEGRFDRETVEPLVVDEPEPLGRAAGPNAARHPFPQTWGRILGCRATHTEHLAIAKHDR